MAAVVAGTVRSVVVSALVALVIPAGAAGQETPAPDAPSQLAVLTAANGTLRDGVLTLRGVKPRATWFLDRPYHLAGVDSTWSLVPSFFKDGSPAPNAAIEIASRRGRADTVILELSRPSVDADRRTVRFRARVLSDAPERMASWRTRHLPTPPARFGRVSVFLDMVSQTCSGVVDLATGDVVAINPLPSTSYGNWVVTLAQTLSMGSTSAFNQTGAPMTGCGGSMIYTLVQANGGTQVPDGASGLLTLNWGNPEIGSNSASCSVTYPGLSCVVANQSGYTPTWTYVVYPG